MSKHDDPILAEALAQRANAPEECREIVNKRDHIEGFVGYRCNQPKGHAGEHALRWFIVGNAGA